MAEIPKKSHHGERASEGILQAILRHRLSIRTLATLAFLGIATPAVARDAFSSVKGSMAGSRTALLHENHVGDRHGFQPFEDAKEIRAALKAGKLVSVRDTKAYYVDPRMGDIDPKNKDAYRTLRPHAKQFLDGLANEFYKKFKTQLKVTGLNRTEDYVDILRDVNGNASAISSHMRGTTIDISYKDLDGEERLWLEARLIRAEKAGDVQFTKELKQACYHFMVTRAPHAPVNKKTKLARR